MKVLYKRIIKCEDCPHDKYQADMIDGHWRCSLFKNQNSTDCMRVDYERMKDNCPLGEDGVDDIMRFRD